MPAIPHVRRTLAKSAMGVVFSLALSGAGRAEEAPATPAADTPPPAPAEQPSASTLRPAQTLSPMMLEIESLLAAERAAVEVLAARLEKTHDGQALIALQREVEALKQETQLGILEVQLRYARAAGRDEVVAELERALAARKQPPVPVHASDLDPSLLPK